MAACTVPLSISGGNNFKNYGNLSSRSGLFVKNSVLTIENKPKFSRVKRDLSVRAAEQGKHGSDAGFVAGFLLGSAVFGTLAYVFAPQIRRSVLNEDEYGFKKAKRPIYYDEGLEKTRQTLNRKIGQLNSTIDKVSTRLRGGNNIPKVPLDVDAEEAAF